MLDNYLPLSASSKHIFKADNFLLEINGIKGSYITFSPRDTIHFTKVNPVSLSNKNLAIYEGKYFSEETNSHVTIQCDTSKLVIRFNVDKSYQLIPTFKDAFTINELSCNVQFIRSTQNKISAIKFYFWRTLGIEFKKLN